MPSPRFPIPQGTLDMLILQILSLEPAHGYAIAQRLEQISKSVVQVNQGSLYPALHRLVRVSAGVELDEAIYDAPVNRPIWRRAAFAIFLVAQLGAIVPLYPESGLQLAVLEAGLMAQLLELHAPSTGLGLCQMGEVEFSRVRDAFALEEGHVLVHSLLGGIPRPEDARQRVEEEF